MVLATYPKKPVLNKGMRVIDFFECRSFEAHNVTSQRQDGASSDCKRNVTSDEASTLDDLNSTEKYKTQDFISKSFTECKR